MKLAYDKDSDILYIAFRPSAPGTFSMLPNADGDLLKIDKMSKDVIGVTILDFSRRANKGKLTVPEVAGSFACDFSELIHA